MKFTSRGWVSAAGLLAIFGLSCVTFAAESDDSAPSRKTKTTARAPRELPPAEPLRKQTATQQTAAKQVSRTEEIADSDADDLLLTPPARTSRVSRTITREPIGLGMQPAAHASHGFVPRHEQIPRGQQQYLGRQTITGPNSDQLYVSETIIEGDDGHGAMHVDDCCGSGCGRCARCCLIPCPVVCWENFSMFGGVQGFTGPVNRGETGSFGFHEGLNYGSALPCTPCGELAWQAGVRTTQSNLSGSALTTDERNQTFVTAGLFRRVDWGLQGGVVFDYLRESWYFNGNLSQLRGELSWMFPCKHELGFWFAAEGRGDSVQSRFRDPRTGITTTTTETYRPTDLYAFYYRHRFGEGDYGNARVFAGFTGESDGLIGADVNIPFTNHWSFQSGFTFLVPDEAKGFTLDSGHAQESWNLSMSLVWTPGRNLCSKSYSQPLFNVADNGSFMLDRSGN